MNRANQQAAPALVPWLVIGFVLTTLEGLGALASRLFSQRLGDELRARVTVDVLARAAQRDLAYFEDPRSQDELSRIRTDPAEQISSFVIDVLSAAGNAMQVASLLAVLAFIEPLILVLAGVAALPYLFFQSALAARQYSLEFARATKRRWGQYFVSTLTEPARVGEVKILGLGPTLIGKFRELMAEFRDQDRKLYGQSFLGGSAFVAVTTAAIYLLFLRVAYLVIEGRLTLGDLAIFGGAATRLRNALEALIETVGALFGRALRLRDIQAFLAAPPPAVERAATLGERSAPAIVFENVSFTYPGSTEPALQHLSFAIRTGETVAVFGRNGAGKSTLVKLLAGLYEPSAGRILFAGVDLRSVPRDEFFDRLAFVFQDSARFEASAADNIAYADWRRLRDDKPRVEAIARAAGVEAMIRALPNTYDTQLGRSFGQVELSGGQWQQIAVARAIARAGSLLVLDEPTANFDAHAEHELFSRLRAQAQREERTTVIVSHRPSTVRLAERILVLDGSRLVETGTHTELMATGGAYAQLCELAVLR